MILAAFAAAASLAATPGREELWRDPGRPGAVVYAVPCDRRRDVDADCARFQIGEDPRFTPMGGGYLPVAYGGVSVIWTRQPGTVGPDVVLLGDPGGSGGCMDVVAVTFERGPQVELVNLCVAARPVAVRTAQGPGLVFTPRRSRAAVRLVWNNGEFEPDHTHPPA